MLSRLVLAIAAVSLLTAATPTPQARTAFDRGEKALEGGLLDDAANAYKEAIKLTPKYAAALNGLGSVLFKQGKREDAVAQFKAAIDADPKFKLAYFNLGFAARKLQDFQTAAGAYEKYTELDAVDPDGFYGLAESYRQLQQPDKAIAAYENYLKKEKRPSETKYVEKAKDQIAALKADPQKQKDEAAAKAADAAKTADATRTENPNAKTQEPAKTDGKQPVVVGILTSAPNASANPTLSSKRIADGDKLMQDKKFRDASFAYQDAVNADPNNVEALFKLGNTYAVLGYYSQAIDRWNRVAQMSTDPAIKKSAQDNIARAQAKVASLGGGSPQSQGLNPGSGPVADQTRAVARKAYEDGVKKINGRDYTGALTSLSDAIRSEPTLTVAYIARGSANIGLRRYAEAAADYQYAIRLDSGMASPLYGLAEAYRALGRNADARDYYERYVSSTAPDVRPELQNEARMKAEKLK